jgi:VWFA-related protein
VAVTRHAVRSATKVTTVTKTTKKTNVAFLVFFVTFVCFVPARGPWAVSRETQPPTQQPRPPVFRAGAHYVRVDAYPAARDGQIIEGLTRDDFEIYEDGKLQAIESFEYITFPAWTPEAERKDPRSQEEGFALAADPAYRVFAVVIDRAAFDMVGWNVMHRPLLDFLERALGPKDLFGLVDSKSEWTDFVLAQRTTTARIALSDPAWWQKKDDFDDYEWALVSCGLESLIPLAQVDRTYSLLEGLVRLFAAIRDERKSIIYVADGLTMMRGSMRAMSGNPRGTDVPKIGVTPGGRLGPMPRDAVGGGSASTFCNAERMRLASVDFRYRYEELLKSARAGNVAFYPISPRGLQGYEFTREGKLDLGRHRANEAELDSLRSLASETDGIAIVNTNDLRGGLTRIADDLRAYYVLGYYTTNTKWDGGLRSIKVKLKPKGTAIRARRQYRAPTLADISAMSAAMAAPPPTSATPPPVATLVGHPAAFRVRGKAVEAADVMRVSRTDRLRVEWETNGTLDRRTARILDRNGRPLPVDVPLIEQQGRITVELPLAPFARGDYTLELTIGSGNIAERSVLAFRIQ